MRHFHLSRNVNQTIRSELSCQVNSFFQARWAGFLCERQKRVDEDLYPADGLNRAADRDGVEVWGWGSN